MHYDDKKLMLFGKKKKLTMKNWILKGFINCEGSCIFACFEQCQVEGGYFCYRFLATTKYFSLLASICLALMDLAH